MDASKSLKKPNENLTLVTAEQDLDTLVLKLQEENETVKAHDQALRLYIRQKTDQLLKVMGTLPLNPEELDDDTLISVDPIGIVSDSFTQVLEHLKETNESLSFAMGELQAIFDSAGAGILVVDTNKKITAFNQMSQKQFFPEDVNPHDFTCMDFICNQTCPPDDCILEEVVKSEQILTNSNFEAKGRLYEVIGTPIRDKEEKLTHVILVYTDITERKKNEQALRDAEARLDKILNNAQAGILLIDPDSHTIVYANQAVMEMTGASQKELLGSLCHGFICPAEINHCPITDEHKQIDKSERKLLTVDGRQIPVLKTVSEVEVNNKIHLLESFIDISELKEAEKKLRKSEERYRTLYSTMQEGVAQHRLEYDENGKPVDYVILDINNAYETIVGLTRDQVIGKRASEIYPLVNDQPVSLDIFSRVVQTGNPENFEYDFVELGKIISVSAAKLSDDHFATVFEDATERKKAEEKIERLAYYDSLTGLPNRVLMRDRLSQMAARAKRGTKQVGVFFLDLDHFKRVNDTLGHDTGDQLLKVVAERLQGILRGCDSICRLGGDEFVILIDEIKDRENAAMIACKILEALSKPAVLKGREVYTTTSIGICMYPEDGDEPDTLLKNADTAMYRAKDEGRNTYCFYSSEMNSKALEQLLLANDLRKALEREEFHLVFQPQIDLTHGQMTGVEALLRWTHSDLGDISPTQFVPLAEETGLILSIGDWVLEDACQKAVSLQKETGFPLRMAVNLSTKQFQDPSLVLTVKKTLEKTGLAPSYLELEITESILMDNVENAQRVLYELKEMGVKLAIDDFGTGYSSLSYLRHFPIDRLKVDKTFIQRVCTHPDDAAITEAIIVMGHTIGTKIVAEGVEQKEELDFLLSKECDEVQGFYFSRPLSTDSLVEFITKHASFCFFEGS